jgi:hypothetical protein
LYLLSFDADAVSKNNLTLTQRFLALAAPYQASPEPEKKQIPVIAVPETGKEENKEIPAEKIAVAVPSQPAAQTPEVKKETAPATKPSPQTTPAPGAKKDEVVYRVQILANTKPVGSYNVVVAGKTYKSFEYLYQGGYRTTIGAFSTLSEATRLQNICRQNGYNQAFVVAFKNNIRSNDPELFR